MLFAITGTNNCTVPFTLPVSIHGKDLIPERYEKHFCLGSEIIQDPRCHVAQLCHFGFCFATCPHDLRFVSGGQPDLRVLVTRRSEVGSRRQQVSLRNKAKCRKAKITRQFSESIGFLNERITRNVL